MTWAQAFHDVGIAFAVALGFVGMFWAIGRMR